MVWGHLSNRTSQLSNLHLPLIVPFETGEQNFPLTWLQTCMKKEKTSWLNHVMHLASALGIWELLIHLKILYQLSKALAIIFYKMDKTFHPKMKKSWTAENRFQDTDPETSARFPGSDVTWNTHFLRSGDTPCRTMTLESLTINQWRDWSLIIWVWEQH